MYQTKREKRFTAKSYIVLLLSVTLMASLALTAIGCSETTEPEPGNTEASSSGVASTTATPVELQIFAANSLEKALPEVQALYTELNPNVTFSDTQFKGSGDLVTELQGGAPADILITASTGTMETAIENNNIDENTKVSMFQNDLIVVKQAGSDIVINALDSVSSDAVAKIAIGDADAVPAGAYANQSLFTINLYSDESGKGGTYEEAFGGKVIIQSSVGNVAKTVSTGDAQIGFVYTSDLYRYDGIEQAFVVPADTHKNIVYPGAVVAGSNSAAEAAAFLDFCLTNPKALKIWAEFGFEVAS